MVAKAVPGFTGIVLVAPFGDQNFVWRLGGAEEEIDGTAHGVGMAGSQLIFARKKVRFQHHLFTDARRHIGAHQIEGAIDIAAAIPFPGQADTGTFCGHEILLS